MIPSSPNPAAGVVGEEEGEPASSKGVGLKSAPKSIPRKNSETQLMRMNGTRDNLKSGGLEDEGGVKVVTHACLEGEFVQDEADSAPLTVSRV